MGCFRFSTSVGIIEAKEPPYTADVNGNHTGEKIIRCWYYANQATGERVKLNVRVTPAGNFVVDNQESEVSSEPREKTPSRCSSKKRSRGCFSWFRRRRRKDVKPPEPEVFVVTTPKNLTPKQSKSSLAAAAITDEETDYYDDDVMLAPILPARNHLGSVTRPTKTEKEILQELIDQGLIKPRSLNDVRSKLPKLEAMLDADTREEERREKREKKERQKEEKLENEERKRLRKEETKRINKENKRKEKQRQAKKAADEQTSWLRISESEPITFEQMREKQRLARELRMQEKRKRHEEILRRLEDGDSDVSDNVAEEILFSLPGQVLSGDESPTAML
ncbi:uncharacterized protein [Antedon mediterranea]|uniref:uncharacterized protein n=1 Tax=Antedon mediterranea TaxID=105859 RepID=UPI003AF66E90